MFPAALPMSAAAAAAEQLCFSYRTMTDTYFDELLDSCLCVPQEVNAGPAMFPTGLVESEAMEIVPAGQDIAETALPGTEPPPETGGAVSYLHGAHTASKADLVSALCTMRS